MANKDLELGRQMFHLAFGAAIVMLLKFMLIGKRVILFAIILGLAISYISRTRKIPIIYHFLEKFERKEDMEVFPGKGILSYLIGIFIVLILGFSMEIALASILVLAFGDSVSHIFGLHYGKTRTLLSNNKFIEGTLAGFIAALLGARLFLPWHEAFFASFAAMTAEATGIKLGSRQVDDNLFIPLVAASAVWIMRLF